MAGTVCHVRRSRNARHREENRAALNALAHSVRERLERVNVGTCERYNAPRVRRLRLPVPGTRVGVAAARDTELSAQHPTLIRGACRSPRTRDLPARGAAGTRDNDVADAAVLTALARRFRP